MLAARAHAGQATLVLEEIDRPDAGPGEVIVRVRAAGLAPGLFHVLKHGLVPLLPAAVGHEIAGDVVELGAGVNELEVGQRVRVHPNLTCRSCEYCLTDREQMCSASAMIGHAVFGPDAMPLYQRYHAGGLAEFVRVPAWLVDPLPPNVDYDVGSKVHDLANALRALKLADLRPGATLVVTAATGAMGLATLRLAPLFGVRRVLAVGRSSDRLEAVRQTAPGLIDVVGLDQLDSTWGESGGLTAAVRQALPQGADAAIDFCRKDLALPRFLRHSGTEELWSTWAVTRRPWVLSRRSSLRVIGLWERAIAAEPTRKRCSPCLARELCAQTISSRTRIP